MIRDIIKAFILYRIVSNPMTMFVCTVAIVALLLLAGAFIKFKNGVFSWLCYLSVLTMPLGYVVLTAWSIAYPPEELELSDINTSTYISINSDGITLSKGILRRHKYPLLGVAPIRTQQRLDEVRTLIETYSKNNTIRYKTSRVYSGIVVYDDAGNDLNLLMLKRGYANVAELAPMSYVKAAEVAKKNKLGIWAVTISGSTDPTDYRKFVYLLSIIMMIYSSVLFIFTRRRAYG